MIEVKLKNNFKKALNIIKSLFIVFMANLDILLNINKNQYQIMLLILNIFN